MRNLEQELALLEELQLQDKLSGHHTLLNREGKYYLDGKEITRIEYTTYSKIITGRSQPFKEIRTYEDREVIEDWLLIWDGGKAGTISVAIMPDNGR